ncbi:MAG: response regulator transcription factor [Chloroflexota bacterium]
MTLILVAEDDPFIRRFIATVAEQAGWETTLTENGARAWAAFETDPDAFDVVVTDVRMPVVSGLELAERIRRVSSITIIAISAHGSDEQVVAGLEAGADDYITKPLSAPVLVAKIRGALRRADSTAVRGEGRLEIGDLVLDLDARTLTKAGVPVPLTRTELGVLAYLMPNAGRIVSPAQILGHVWGEAYEEENEILRVAILRLRRKIEDDPSKPRYVVTRVGIGYSFAKQP